MKKTASYHAIVSARDVEMTPLVPAQGALREGTHTTTPTGLVALSKELFDREPGAVFLGTIPACVFDHGDSFSPLTAKKVEEFLGVPKFRSRLRRKENRVGSVTGLAWTSVGGDILHVDVTVMSGQERLTLTGQLGDIMKESAQAALSYLRSQARSLRLPTNFWKGKEIHIHVPEGSIPKDGPSAGITMAMAMYSAVSGKAARNDVAMTGEITLRGEVLAIGGLTEKLLAAQRSGIAKVLIPKENVRDLEEISTKVKEGLTIVPITTIEQALKHVFGQGGRSG